VSALRNFSRALPLQWPVTSVAHTRASRPRDATDEERLDGSNGLLLSPHVDHLFDQGYITFSPSHHLLIVPEVRDKLLDAWGIDAGVNVGEFSREQSAYLDYHRVQVFKGDT
jgi:putative restriction endonuclease